MRGRPVAGLLRKKELFGSRLVEYGMGIKVIFVLSCIEQGNFFIHFLF
jgi:hypothetical protein